MKSVLSQVPNLGSGILHTTWTSFSLSARGYKKADPKLKSSFQAERKKTVQMAKGKEIAKLLLQLSSNPYISLAEMISWLATPSARGA